MRYIFIYKCSSFFCYLVQLQCAICLDKQLEQYNPKVIKFFTEAMKNRKVELTAREKILDEIVIQRGIILEDALSL